MSRLFLALAASLFLSVQAIAELDSLIRINEISFSNSFEQSVFSEQGKTGSDFFYGYMVYSSDDSIQIARYKDSFEQRIQNFKRGQTSKK